MPTTYTIGHAKGRIPRPQVQILVPRIPRLEYAGVETHSTLGRTRPDSYAITTN
jgi:hypothetical protein